MHAIEMTARRRDVARMRIRYFEVVIDAAGLHLADIRQLKKFAAEERVCRR